MELFQNEKCKHILSLLLEVNIRMNIALSRIESCVLITTDEQEMRSRDEKAQQEIELPAVLA